MIKTSKILMASQTIHFLKNPAKAPKVNWADQDLEPAGFYCTLYTEDTKVPEGWYTGKAYVTNPLHIDLGTYNTESSWKYVLSHKYKATGKLLARYILNDGYDTIMTNDSYGTQEIVLLNPSAQIIG